MPQFHLVFDAIGRGVPIPGWYDGRDIKGRIFFFGVHIKAMRKVSSTPPLIHNRYHLFIVFHPCDIIIAVRSRERCLLPCENPPTEIFRYLDAARRNMEINIAIDKMPEGLIKM